ncbi:isopenicillin N synthase family dioxygenase [Acidimangrovimonas sediminis]|uniref:isopenicillin N synthase family dioxygenase n=1 Tax=Acidimangrovimonas sediminis TaxID=2056283 RepID=UPI000C80D10C|nr:2-oxoglutarate and iron-dependent oxygenase domain-containing protein [Acidimangrovimonas sediminis]
MTDAPLIPLLDWSLYSGGADRAGFVAALGQACRETGFFLLENHGLSEALVAETFAQGDAFFALPDAEKAPLDIRRNPHNRGWACQGSEALDEQSGQMDRKEAFNVGFDLPPRDPRVVAGEPFRGVNVWPALPGFRETLMRYYEAALNLGVTLMSAVAEDLSLPPDRFGPEFTEPMATLRLLHYPASAGTGAGTGDRTGEGIGEGIGAGAHTDYGALTLLMTDGVAGLQVKPRGADWLDVPQVPGALVVNIGDCLMRWTNDTYASTPHRVLAPKARRRSIAFFLDPNPDSVIAALPGTGTPRYPEVTGADYLRARLNATYTPEPK